MESNAILFSDKEKNFKIQTGEEFTFMYKKYYSKLIYFTNKICGDEQKAEDVSTEAFMTALDKIDKYDKEKSQFSTWLFTIARNLALQDLRQEKRKVSLDIEYDNDGTTMKDFITQNDNTYDFDKHEMLEKKATIMKDHIKTLKEPYRTVIEMREIQKMAYKDIASHLDMNLSTLKSRIRNGRKILIERSKQEFENIDKSYK